MKYISILLVTCLIGCGSESQTGSDHDSNPSPSHQGPAPSFEPGNGVTCEGAYIVGGLIEIVAEYNDLVDYDFVEFDADCMAHFQGCDEPIEFNSSVNTLDPNGGIVYFHDPNGLCHPVNIQCNYLFTSENEMELICEVRP